MAPAFGYECAHDVWIGCLSQRDNQTALPMVKEAKLTAASKHISIFYHLKRKKVEQGNIVIQQIPFEKSLSEIVTKGRKAHNKLGNLIRINLGRSDTNV